MSPLRVETPEERRLFVLGEKNYNAKKELAKIALRKQTPNDEESDMIHAMWLKHLEYQGMVYFVSFQVFYDTRFPLNYMKISFIGFRS